MVMLNPSLHFLVACILVGSFVVLILAVLLGIAKGLRNVRAAREKALLERCRELIHEYVDQPDSSLLPKIPRVEAVRDYLLEISEVLSPRHHGGLRKLYQKLGFARQDLLILHRSTFSRVSEALVRLTAMQIRPPRSALDELLQHPRFPLRRLAMSCLVAVRGERGFSDLWTFVCAPENRIHRGAMVGLLSEYAQVAPRALGRVLARMEDREHVELLLRAAAVAHEPVEDSVLLSFLEGEFGPEVQAQALRILADRPGDEHWIEPVRRLVGSADPAVRALAGKVLLGSVGTDAAVRFAEPLLVDPGFDVRVDVCEGFLGCRKGAANRVLAEVLRDQKHPSWRILRNLRSVSELRDAPSGGTA